MPRGVPNSGFRKPRRQAPPQSVAGGAVDLPAGDDPPTAVPAPPAPPPVVTEPVYDAEPVDEDEPGEWVPEAPSEPVRVDEPLVQTPEQREIELLRHQVAQLSGKKDVEPEAEPLTEPGSEGNIVIHFLEDGLTALGKVWYRGQELEFERGSRAYQDTFNRFGRTWLELVDKEFEQVDRWGKIMFRAGRWPGKSYLDGTFEPLRSEKDDSRVPAPSQQELEAAEQQRQTQRAAPRLPQQV